MSSANRPARLNRTLLLLVGLVLLLGGALLLAAAFGLLPGLVNPTSTPVRAAPEPPGWAMWVAAVIIRLLCLRWLAGQTVRRPKTRCWQLAADPARGRTHLAADTAGDPLVTEIEHCPGGAPGLSPPRRTADPAHPASGGDHRRPRRHLRPSPPHRHRHAAPAAPGPRPRPPRRRLLRLDDTYSPAPSNQGADR